MQSQGRQPLSQSVYQVKQLFLNSSCMAKVLVPFVRKDEIGCRFVRHFVVIIECMHSNVLL